MKVEYKSLKEIVKTVIDYRGKTPFKLGGEWSDSGYRALSALNVKTRGLVAEDKIRYVNEDLYRKWMKEEVKRGDILITSEAPFGQVLQWNSDEKIVLSQRLFALRIKPNYCSSYIYHYMASDFFYGELRARATGSTVEGLRQPALMKCKIAIPSWDCQCQIASILSAYDSQIENNQKRIKLLEQMAENLYKEWFVRFRFPGYENAEFEGGIPKGWKQVTLGEYANVIMGQSPESCFYNNDKQGLPFHQGVGSYGDFYLQDDVYSTEGKRITEANSIIFSVRAPVGRINITLNRIILGRGVAGINAKNGNNALLLWILKNKFAKEDIIGNGSIFTSVTKDELLGQKILIPIKKIEESFNTLASNIEKEIRFLTLQKDNLTHQRDLLLPRLMSGKLSI